MSTPADTKRCPRCRAVLPLLDFHPSASACRPCETSRIREYRQTDRGREANKLAWYKARDKRREASL